MSDRPIRLYSIIFEEGSVNYETIVPEWMLPEFPDIESIEVVGYLYPELDIVRAEDPDDPEKEPVIVPLRANQ